jgi:type VI secretion system secreted protein Hcp
VAYSVFFKMTNVYGQSSALGYHKWIELDSWSWGASRALDIAGAPARLSVQSFSFTSRVGSHSTALLELLASNEATPSGTTLVVTKEELPAVQLSAEFSDVILSVYDIGEASGDIPLEQVSFDFSKVTLTTGTSSPVVVVNPPGAGG